MGQCSSQSPEVEEQLRKNKALEKQLAQAQQKDASKIKLLLLGKFLDVELVLSSVLLLLLTVSLSRFRMHFAYPSGAGECGKSTFFKQIGMLYGKPWSHTERMNFRRIIHANTIQV